MSLPRKALPVLAILPLILSGCNLLLAPFMMFAQEPTRKVPAEFPHLAGRKVCLIVWTEMDTLFEYPLVQLEVSEHVQYAMQSNVKKASFVSSREVVDLQRRELDWDRQHPGTIGRRFAADYTLLIEITRYSTRDPESPHLYRGHISANLKVYDTAHPDAPPTYRGTIDTLFPPDSPGEWGADDNSIRRATMEQFGRDVAGKFYDRQVKDK
ncbi:hypothetical protein RAS1_10220 [Phycisphaerae bacterium RAS1]|nr:hypothetical protein RAS1_10220 [Phycisphaerae bacterium RAS1]